MAARRESRASFTTLFTVCERIIGHGRAVNHRRWEEDGMVVGIAIAMFIALFGWGANYFGWSDPERQGAACARHELHPRHHRRLQGQELSLITAELRHPIAVVINVAE